MKNSFYLYVIICCSIIFLSFRHDVSAACIGNIPVFGSGDTKATCKAKQGEIPAQEVQPQTETKPEPTQNNQGVGSGAHNTNFIVGDLPSSQSQETLEEDSGLVLTTHQVRIEIAPYVIPGAYQLDKPGMPERVFFNGFAWEYYINKTLGFGLLWQEWSKTGARNFDPITYTDSSGDIHTLGLPGAVNRLKYTLYIPYVTINAKLAPKWCLGGRFGIGHVGVEAEYNESKINSGNSKYSDNASMLVDLFIERWFSGARIGGALRYINAQTDTTDYLQYINLGSAQVVFYAQFTIKAFGLL